MVFLLSIGNNGRQKKVVKRAEETAAPSARCRTIY